MMNRLLFEIIRRTVAGEWTPIQALQSAWESGIREGMARQRVKEILETSDELLEGDSPVED